MRATHSPDIPAKNFFTVGLNMSEIGAVVKVVDSHLYGWGSIPGKSCSFLIVF